MTRSSYKLPYTARALKNSKDLKKDLFMFLPSSEKATLSASQKQIHQSSTLVYQRSSTILPEMIGNNVKIHSGQKFVKFIITEHTVGYKFGEFAPTKKRALYKKKKKR